MPIRYRIIEDKKLVYVVGSGRITLSDLLTHMDELSHDPHYNAPMKKLVDYRKVNHVDTHGQARGTFTAQASLDLNPGVPAILRI